MTGNFKNLHYSSENQLIKIETFVSNNKIKEVDYYYDALGRRSRKVVQDFQNSANNDERQYVYDGQEILAELDGSDNTLAVYTHSTLRTDDTLAVDVQDTKLASSTGTYYYLKDALGSIVDIANSAGNIVQHYSYSSFGKILGITNGAGVDISSNPNVKTSYGFTNREHDSESGMMYYRARYMMPEIGRFIQEDPHPGNMINPITGINKYSYVVNNPLRFTDSAGRFLDPVSIVIYGAILGAINASLNGEDIIQGAIHGAITGAIAGLTYTYSPFAFYIGLGVSAGTAAVTRKGGFLENTYNNAILNFSFGFFGGGAKESAVLLTGSKVLGYALTLLGGINTLNEIRQQACDPEEGTLGEGNEFCKEIIL